MAAGPLEPTEEQLQLIAAAMALARMESEDPNMAAARVAWENVRDIVLTDAMEACETELLKNRCDVQEARDWIIGCIAAIRAMKGTP